MQEDGWSANAKQFGYFLFARHSVGSPKIAVAIEEGTFGRDGIQDRHRSLRRSRPATAVGDNSDLKVLSQTDDVLGEIFATQPLQEIEV